jgi:methyl-accepting chemotaxis protein
VSSRLLFWFDWPVAAKVVSITACVMAVTLVSLVLTQYLTLNRQMIQETGDDLLLDGKSYIELAASTVDENARLLGTLALSPSIVDWVERANQAHRSYTPDQIASLDQSWKDGEADLEPVVQEILENPTSQLLNTFISKYPEEIEVFVTDAQGLNVAMTGRTSDYLQADESWWKAAFDQKQAFIDEVEYDESSKAYAMNIGVPIFDREQKQVIGVLRGTVDLSRVMDSLSQVNIGTRGYLILVNNAGNILYSPQPDRLMAPVPEMYQGLLDSPSSAWEEGLTDLNGEAALVGFVPLEGELADSLGWRLLLVHHVREISQGAIQTLTSGLLFLLITTLICVGYTLWAVRFISVPVRAATLTLKDLSQGTLTPRDNKNHWNVRTGTKDEMGMLKQTLQDTTGYLQEMAGIARRIAGGDLTVEVTPRSDDDELGVAYQEMVRDLRNAVGKVASSAQAVTDASERLAVTSNQAGQATSQIATTIQQVASGTTQQSTSVTMTVGSVDRMSQEIERVARGAQEQTKAAALADQVTQRISGAIRQVAENNQAVLRYSRDAAGSARSGSQSVMETLQRMETIRDKVGSSAQKVLEMGDRSARIGSILETIEDIASQTNMLALKAAIEAARAGEHGKGFAVVADEVRKLAERASSATREIGALIGGIQQAVDEAVATMQEGTREVENGVTWANGAGAGLDDIRQSADRVCAEAEQATKLAQEMDSAAKELVQAVGAVIRVIDGNSASAQQMSTQADAVTQAMENIASVSEENSASVEEVLASAEEMSAQVQEVSQSAASLSSMAQALQQVVAQFSLQGASDEPAPQPAAQRVDPHGSNGRKHLQPAGKAY